MSIIQTQSKSVAQFASGLYGYALGEPTNNAVLTEAGLAGLNTVFNSYYAQTFSALSADSVARVVVSNVGIVAGQNGLTTAIVNEAVTYVKNALTAAAATGTQGQVVASLLIGFSNMAADPVFGAAARAWNTQVDKDMAYTSSGALLDVPTALAIVPTPPTPTFSVAVNDADKSIVEGGAVTYTIVTTNVAAGTDVGYSVSGTNNAQTAAKSGLATVNEQGIATVTVTTTDNSVVGDTGTLTFTVVSGATTLATAEAVTVASEDTAVVVPTYSVTASDIAEGGTATFNVVTTGVAAGTDIAYTIVGTNNAAGTHSGLVRIGLDGTGTVTLETAENETPADAGQLDFTLGGTLATERVIVSNNDGNAINNTYTLTSAENNFSDTNGGDDTFIGSIGVTAHTLTSADDLNGGTGTNTLHIDVVEDNAVLPVMDGNTSSFVNIQNVELDLTRNYLVDGESDSYAELQDFETAYFDDATGSLQKVSQIITSDSGTSSFADVLVHKNLTLVYEGSGVAGTAENIDAHIMLEEHDAAELTQVDIVLDGIGGDSWIDFGGEYHSDDDYFGDNSTLETITVTGNVAMDPWYGADASFELHSHAQDELDSWYTHEGSLNALNDIIISLDDTNAKNILVGFDGFDANNAYNVEDGEDEDEDVQNQILWNVTNLDFSGSTANIGTYGEVAIRKTDFDSATVEIKYGSGDDILELDIGYAQEPEWSGYRWYTDDFDNVFSSAVKDKEGATQITIDMGQFSGDNNELILTQGGNIDSVYSPNDNGDLLEDMIVVKNWDIQEDTLQLANFTMHLGDTDEYGEVGEDTDAWGYYAWLDELDFVNTTEVQSAIADVVLANTNSNNGLYNVVDAVADYMADILRDDYDFDYSSSEDYFLIADNAAAFTFKGDTYVYVDTDRTYDDYNDGNYDDFQYDNIGLSAGDTLIKFTGITSLNMENITSYENFNDGYGQYVYTDFSW